MDASPPKDPVLSALANLQRVLEESADRTRTALKSAELIRDLREKGKPYSEIVPLEPRPLIVEVITETLQELADASSRFRKAEARALYEEGLTMAEVAELFGVSRQRVAMLLRSK